MIINIEENWKNILQPEFDKESFKNLSRFVNSEYVNNICYPEEKNIFSAFNTCLLENLKQYNKSKLTSCREQGQYVRRSMDVHIYKMFRLYRKTYSDASEITLIVCLQSAQFG